jgi:hypothetical protein
LGRLAPHHFIQSPTALAVTMMPQTSWASTPAERMKYQSIFVSALKDYEEKTGKVLSSDPLLRRLEKCRSPDDIITILWQQIPAIGPSWSGHISLTRWLNPTVNVINSFSAAVDGAIGLVSPTETEAIHPQSGTLIVISVGAYTRSLDLYGHWRSPFSKSLFPDFLLNALL